MANRNLPSVSGSSNNSDDNTNSNSGQSNVGPEGGKNLQSLNTNSVQSKDDDTIFQYIRCNLCAREFDTVSKLNAHKMRSHPRKRARGINGEFTVNDNSDNLQSMIISIKELYAKDVPLVRNLMLSAYPEKECDSESEIAKNLDYSKKIAINLSYAAWHNNQMVAFLLTEIKPSDCISPYLHTIVVRDEYRRKCLGKKLIEMMIAKCNENRNVFRFDRITLHCEVTNHRAIKIYEQLGFTLIERLNNLYGEERHGQLMSRPL